LIEAGPPGPAFVLRFGRKQRFAASGADEHAFALLGVQRTRTARFGTVLAQHLVLGRRQRGLPFLVCLLHFKVFFGGHDFDYSQWAVGVRMLRMRRSLPFILILALAGTAGISSQAPRTHRLEATPETVAYGYYWSEAKPALRVASGDIIDVDTLLTNTPQGLARAGLADDRIQPSLKAITAALPQGNPARGLGGHILTGPVFVEGAEPGDALEVKILSIDLPIDYGYNACSGPLHKENCGPSRTTIIPIARTPMTSEFLPGIRIP